MQFEKFKNFESIFHIFLIFLKHVTFAMLVQYEKLTVWLQKIIRLYVAYIRTNIIWQMGSLRENWQNTVQLIYIDFKQGQALFELNLEALSAR